MEGRRKPKNSAVVALMDLLGRLNLEVFTGRMSTLPACGLPLPYNRLS
jgi:hypothetical protein